MAEGDAPGLQGAISLEQRCASALRATRRRRAFALGFQWVMGGSGDVIVLSTRRETDGICGAAT